MLYRTLIKMESYSQSKHDYFGYLIISSGTTDK